MLLNLGRFGYIPYNMLGESSHIEGNIGERKRVKGDDSRGRINELFLIMRKNWTVRLRAALLFPSYSYCGWWARRATWKTNWNRLTTRRQMIHQPWGNSPYCLNTVSPYSMFIGHRAISSFSFPFLAHFWQWYSNDIPLSWI